jgi:2-polyprenyl-6-methoxyphenol hydroxylase-like FAD-dependent oxidoreductase
MYRAFRLFVTTIITFIFLQMHPMAGQGLNLGLQDVSDLVNVISKAASSGMDVATFLDDYERTRKVQCSLTLGGIHALHNIFGAQHTVAKHVKALGMNMIQNIPPLRRAMVQVASQGVATK